MMKSITKLMIAGLLCVAAPLQADQHALFTTQSLTPEIALKAARAALEKCRGEGYQVAVAVTDRMGVVQVVLRDRFAGAHTPDTAMRKAWTTASFRTNTSELLSITGPGEPQAGVREVTNALVLGGALMIEVAGSLVGVIGVSGAPGGDLDDVCAAAGIEAIEEDILF